MRLRRLWSIFVSAAGLWLGRNAFVHAGALAFYTLFSLSPVLIITVSIAGAVFGEEAARGQLLGQLQGLVGNNAAHVVEDALANARPAATGVLPAVTGLLALLVGATTVFAQLQLSLNRMWEVTARPRTGLGILLMIKQRLLSLALVVTIGFILVVSLAVNVAVHAALRFANTRVAVPAVALDGAELVLSFVVISTLFAVVFKWLPDVEVEWKDVRAGAMITAALFIGGRYGIAMYLAYSAPDTPFGAAGSLVILLLWVYYSSLILFFGAALTKARAIAYGRPVKPKPTAVRVREELVEETKPAKL